MTKAQLRTLRDRLYLTDDIPDSALEGDPPYIRPAEGSDAMEYLRARGPRPRRPAARPGRPARRRALRPDAKVFEEFAAGSGTQSVSTTMVFARLLRNLVRDPTVGSLVAPIVSDEARTFGLEPLIAEAKIYAPDGQNYVPVDADLPLNYAESSSGQMLQEGITEAGALASFIALATAYATWGQPMLPVYLFYSMFGFQRVGDLAWALGDMRGRGILAGCTAGRTTLMGEGLQHDDGQSPLLASTNPAAMVYDASFAYEVAVIMEAAVTEMLGPEPQGPLLVPHALQRDLPDAGAARGGGGRGRPPGHHRRAPTATPRRPRCDGQATCGPRCASRADVERRASRHSSILAERYGVARRRLGRDVVDQPAHRRARGGTLEPAAPRGGAARAATSRRPSGAGRTPWSPSPTTCAAVPDQVARFVDRPYTSLGTDGFGRSDARDALRSYFEVDAAHLVVAVLQQLARGGPHRPATVAAAIADLGIDPARAAPFTRAENGSAIEARASSAPAGTESTSVRRSASMSM